MLISGHSQPLPCRILLVPRGRTVNSRCELRIDLFHLVLHPVLLPRMYRIHDLNRVLLIPYINLSPLPCLLLPLGHLLIDPVWFRLLPLLLDLIPDCHELIIVSELCLQIDVAHVLVELLGFLCFMLFKRGELSIVRVLVKNFLVVGGLIVFLGLTEGGVTLDLHVEKLPHLLLHLVFHLETELLSFLKLIKPGLLGHFILLISRLQSLKLS